jgi:hypothetical protein
MPADDIQGDVLGASNGVAIDNDEFATLRAGFANMPSLQVARKDDAWVSLSDDLTSMDVTEREVIVILCRQRRHVRGSVGIMTYPTGQAGVQHADVEAASDRFVI